MICCLLRDLMVTGLINNMQCGQQGKTTFETMENEAKR
jgi:hypothetical protein